MGRRSKAGPALVRVRAERIVDALEAPEVVRATERFLELRRQILRDAVDTIVELGQILMETRPLLRGHYHRWLTERLHIEPSTASNYMDLARLADASPGSIQRGKELGIAKLYQVARLEPAGRRTVLRAPGLERMNDLQFSTLVARHRVSTRRVTGNMKAHGLRMKVQAFADVLEGIRRMSVDNPAVRAGLAADLRRVERAASGLRRRL